MFTVSIPFRKFFEISDVANDREAGPVAQRPLDPNHAKKLAVYMVKGLVSAAKMRRAIRGIDVPPAFDEVLRKLGEQPYFSIQPLVCATSATLSPVQPDRTAFAGCALRRTEVKPPASVSSWRNGMFYG